MAGGPAGAAAPCRRPGRIAGGRGGAMNHPAAPGATPRTARLLGQTLSRRRHAPGRRLVPCQQARLRRRPGNALATPHPGLRQRLGGGPPAALGWPVIASTSRRQRWRWPARCWPGRRSIWSAPIFSPIRPAPIDCIYERAFLCALPRKLWPDWAARVAGCCRRGRLAGYFFVCDQLRGRLSASRRTNSLPSLSPPSNPWKPRRGPRIRSPFRRPRALGRSGDEKARHDK